MTEFARASGVLLPVASLPRGVLGDDALRFVDWLGEAGQRWWQILPFGPPDRWGSPYAATSAFAGSPTWLSDPGAPVSDDEIAAFSASHPFWASSWSTFAGPDALADQVRFAREWRRVRAHAAARDVRILGDMPFGVAPGSADQRAMPALFRAGVVGGVPPDAWAVDGQHWGTPVYDWPEVRARGYRWWIERFRRAYELVDAVRIDHFRGFVAAWEIPEGAASAREGRWVRGPGRAVFDAVRRELGAVPVVAENLGLITPAVERLRTELGVPGTLVLQFSVADGTALGMAPDTVVYTGTHDNDTTVGWWDQASAGTRSRLIDAVRAGGWHDTEPQWMLARIAHESAAQLSILPVQDVLGLGSEARINVPGRAADNWRWRLDPGALTPELAARVRDLTEATGRLR